LFLSSSVVDVARWSFTTRDAAYFTMEQEKRNILSQYSFDDLAEQYYAKWE
jgi:hypothetical protein